MICEICGNTEPAYCKYRGVLYCWSDDCQIKLYKELEINNDKVRTRLFEYYDHSKIEYVDNIFESTLNILIEEKPELIEYWVKLNAEN